MESKNPITVTERHNMIFIVQGHEDRKTELLIHTSNSKIPKYTINVHIISFTYFHVRSQYVTQAYNQVKNLSHNVYV